MTTDVILGNGLDGGRALHLLSRLPVTFSLIEAARGLP